MAVKTSYQYLLGKVSTKALVEFIDQRAAYQYLLGKVSTIATSVAGSLHNKVSISIR